AVLSSEKDQLRLRPSLADRGCRLRTRSIREPEVEQHHVRSELSRRRDGLPDRTRLTNDPHVRLVIDQRGQAFGDDAMILDDEDANRVAPWGAVAIPKGLGR